MSPINSVYSLGDSNPRRSSPSDRSRSVISTTRYPKLGSINECRKVSVLHDVFRVTSQSLQQNLQNWHPRVESSYRNQRFVFFEPKSLGEGIIKQDLFNVAAALH